MPSNDDVPTEISALEDGAVLYDRHRKEYFVVTDVDEEGVGLHQSDTDFYVPHSLYVTWQDTRLIPTDELSNPDIPGWVAEYR